jgi:sulfur relay (sulfurtransferase) DsrC/TusE family protein
MEKPPQSPFDVRRAVTRDIAERALGYRAQIVWNYLRDHFEEFGIPPSYEMIANACDITKGKPQVWQIINSLEQRGKVYREGTGRTRRIRLGRT